MIEILSRNYKKVYLWLQSIEDYKYFKSLGINHNIEFVGPSLRQYDELIQTNESIDYVGTRLHGGVRALNNGIRTIIIVIDNRAK